MWLKNYDKIENQIKASIYYDRVSINSDHFVSYHLLWSHTYMKIKQIKSKYECKNTITKINQFVPKYEMNQQTNLVADFFFLLFSVTSNKQTS